MIINKFDIKSTDINYKVEYENINIKYNELLIKSCDLSNANLNLKKEIKNLTGIKKMCKSTSKECGINTINITDDIKCDKINKKTCDNILDDKNKLLESYDIMNLK
jgi:tryptophanyl-tRNA synthetase